jgi:hypothetical protein
MDNMNNRKLNSKPKNAYAALGGYKLTRKDKLAYIGLLIAVVILLLCWWARSSGQ